MALGGPSRRPVSVPFSKSKTALAKFAPICSSKAPMNAANAGPNANSFPRSARAQPTNTGAIAAGSVGIRIANFQAFKFIDGIFVIVYGPLLFGQHHQKASSF